MHTKLRNLFEDGHLEEQEGEDSIKMDLKELGFERWEVDGAGLRSSSLAGCAINCVELVGYATSVSVR
jgi:hypothetical protein